MKAVETARRHWKPLIAGGSVMAVLLTAAVATTSGKDAEKKPEGQAAEARRQGQAVTVFPAEVHAFTREAAVSGDARPVDDVQVFAPVTGVRVLEVLVEAGDRVERGQPLARLDTRVAEAQLRAAEASVELARVDQIRTKAEYERALAVIETGALSQEALETRRAAAQSAEAQLASAEASLAEVNARLQGGFIRAPQGGLVLERTARPGELADQRALFRIAGDNKLEVAAEVSEADVLALEKGQPAIFRLPDGSEVTAKLRVLPAAIDPATRTGTALFDLPADPRIRVGTFLRGSVNLGEAQLLAAPQDSIRYDAQGASVFVVSAGNVVRRTPVTLGPRDGDLVALLTGVEAGDLIAGGGSAFLLDGDEVRPMRAAEGAEPAAVAADPTIRTPG